MKKKYFVFTTAPFETQVMFLNGTSEKETERILKKYKISPDYAKEIVAGVKKGSRGFCACDDENRICMWINKNESPIGWQSTLVHELQHLIAISYKITGWKYDIENPEPHCHLSSYLYEQVMNRLSPKIKKK